MKMVGLFLLFLVQVSLGFSQKYKGDSWSSIKSAGTGALAVVYYEQPGHIHEINGKHVGLCVDVLDDFVAFIQSKYNVSITIKYLGKESAFSEFLSVAQNNKDVLAVSTVTITEERRKMMKFTPPYITNPVVMVTHKDAPAINSLSELSKKLPGYSAKIIGGSTHIKLINKVKEDFWPELNITYGPSGIEILKNITSDKKLFTFLDFTELWDATRKRLPVKKQNVDLGEIVELAFAMSRQSDWDIVWKEFLTEDYRKGAKYRKHVADNFGPSFLSLLK